MDRLLKSGGEVATVLKFAVAYGAMRQPVANYGQGASSGACWNYQDRYASNIVSRRAAVGSLKGAWPTLPDLSRSIERNMRPHWERCIVHFDKDVGDFAVLRAVGSALLGRLGSRVRSAFGQSSRTPFEKSWETVCTH